MEDEISKSLRAIDALRIAYIEEQDEAFEIAKKLALEDKSYSMHRNDD